MVRQRFMRQALGTATVVALGVLLVAGYATRAQDPANKTEPKKLLLMIVKTKSNISEDTIREKFEACFVYEQLESKNDPKSKNYDPKREPRPARYSWRELVPNTISSSTYDEIAEMLDQGVTEEAREGSSDSVQMRMRSARDSRIDMKFKDPNLELTKLDVEYVGGSKESFTPAPPSKMGPQPKLVTEGPGRFSLAIDPKKPAPIKYTATVKSVEDLDGEAKKLEGDFPKTDLYYIIKLVGFDGSRDQLLTDLKDKEIVPEPIENITVGDDLMLAFAYFKTQPAGWTLAWDGTIFVPRVNDLSGRGVKRVWMMFPLTKEEAEAKLAEYRTITVPKDVSKSIRDSKPVLATDDKFTLNDQTKGQWIELSKVGMNDFFERRIPLEKDSIAKLKEKYKEVYRLLVWEFDNGATVAAIRVEDKGNEYLVVDQEVKEWPLGIANAVKKTEK